MADIEQGEKETPGKFLDRLWEALHKFTDVDFESAEGEMIVKDRFLTQSAPHSCRKLQKLAFGPNQSLENLLPLAQSEYYGREYMEENKGKKEPGKRLKP